MAGTSQDVDKRTAAPDAQIDEIPRLHFEHKLFGAVDGACFRRSPTDRKQPIFVMDFGGNEVSLPFEGIKQEFEIEDDSPDGQMLELVAQCLRFVKAIRPGDPLPKEIVTGEASWEITKEHREVAYHRLTTQLASWLTGDQHLITDREELLQIAEDPATKKKINEAFGEAAAYLGLAREDKDQVVDLITRLADDLAGIEALRDAFKSVLMMQVKIQGLRRAFGNEMSVLEVADPVARLMAIAASEFADQFELIDAQTGEIMAALKNIEAQSKFIREARDRLYQDLVEWNDMFQQWSQSQVARNDANVLLLRKTYRFLAPRYVKNDDWDLKTKRDAEKPLKNAMKW